MPLRSGLLPPTAPPDPEVRLVRRAATHPVVDLDEDQRAALDRAAAGEPLLVVGAPGTGKTTTAVEIVVDRVARGLDPRDALLIAPGRRAAGALRNRVSARVRRTTGQPMVRTAASVAFSVLRARAAALGDGPPTLISGPEQDLLLAELLAGHRAGVGVQPNWPDSIPAAALGLRAFRDELRDLLMRAAERGLDPEDLARLGRAAGRPEWVAAAAVYDEYLGVTALRTSTPDAGPRYDPAVVVDEAALALRDWESEVPRTPRPRWRLVVVDDYQEATAATVRLLRALADDGAQLVLVGDPDVAVQTFRGADPGMLARAELPGRGPGEFGAQRVVLRTTWRQPEPLRRVTVRVTECIGTAGLVAHRAARPRPGAAAGSVQALVTRGVAQEAAVIAQIVRRAHVKDKVGWAEMAVIVRSGARLAALRRGLVAAGVPVVVPGAQVPVRDEPAVRPLLLAMEVALRDPGELEAEHAVALLTSPLGGLDSVGLRRLRRALRAEEIAAGGGRSSDELLVEVLGDPGRSAVLAPHVRRAPERVAAVLAAARAAAAEPDATAESVLWAVWETAGLSPLWERVALAGGPAGARADRDLDAVLALFRAAEQFTDRLPRSHAAAFLDYLQGQDLPGDTLAAQARTGPAVTLTTAAGAAGQEWRLVVVAGVQDGVWPDLRLRDSVLGAQALVHLLADGHAGADRDARREVLHDELRAFAVAVSRASERLVVTAVQDADERPSPFLRLVADAAGVEERPVDPPRPLDLRGLVAAARAALLEDPGSSDAARALALLAEHGVAGADPAQWHGLVPTSVESEIWRGDDVVPLSPSKVELAATCPLRWLLETAGGRPATALDQSVGNLVHAVASRHPNGTLEELQADLDVAWERLGLPDTWLTAAGKRKADAMIRRLAAYIARHPHPAVTEVSFDVVVGRVQLRGRVDRLELHGDGSARVVDLKTGANPVSAAEAQRNAQLGVYQAAVERGGFDSATTSAGAALLYLGGERRGAAERPQEPLAGAEDPTWVETLLGSVADDVAAATFEARVNDGCRHCPVQRSCPVRDEGRQVTP